MDVCDLESLVTRARDAFNEGRPHESGRLYRDALVAIGDGSRDPDVGPLHVRALLGVANARFEADGDLASCLATIDDADRVSRTVGGVDLRPAVLGQRARALLLAGRIDDAMKTFGEAEGHLAGATPRDRLTLLVNRGVLHMDVGSPEAARTDLARALAEAESTGQPLLAYKARHNLGWVRFLEGDLPGAMAWMAAAPRAATGSDDLPGEDPIALLDRGRVLLEAGLADEADEMLAAAVEEFRATGRVHDQAEAMVGRARAALLDRDPDRAGRHARAAMAAFHGRDNRRWEHRAHVLALEAELLRLRGDDDPVCQPGDLVGASVDGLALADLLAEARSLARAAGDDVDVASTARLIAVDAAVASDALADADQLLAGVEPQRLATVAARLRWHRARAALAVARGGPGAITAVAEGVADLAAAQSQLGSLDLRTAMAVHARGLVQLGIRAALTDGDPEQVHWAVEVAHASSTRLASVRTRHTGRDRELLGRLRRAEEALWRPDLPSRERATLQEQVDDLQRRLRRRDWRRPSPQVDPSDVVDLATLRRSLAAHDAVAVSFVVCGGRWQAVRVDRDGLAVVDVGAREQLVDPLLRLRADLRVRLLTSVRGPMAAAVDASLHAALAELDDRLCARLGLDGRPLVVVPHGDLALVPWSLLPSRRGRATTVAPCATRWVTADRAVRAAGSGPGTGPVVVALAGPRLERAEEEAEAVATGWGGRVVRGVDVTGASLRAALGSADVVHLAVHGTHRRRSPLFSSVLLDDGPFYAHELDRSCGAGLVLLSACEVGEHSIRPGDEPLGLSAALLEGGTNTVVASIGRLRDDVAGSVMVAVHDQLRAGASPAAAVATATDEALAAGEVAPLVVLGGGLGSVVEPPRGMAVP